ncbi:MAG: hypothetical protein ACRDT6_13465 [Micromonosporaceae bacterium]
MRITYRRRHPISQLEHKLAGQLRRHAIDLRTRDTIPLDLWRVIDIELVQHARRARKGRLSNRANLVPESTAAVVAGVE